MDQTQYVYELLNISYIIVLYIICTNLNFGWKIVKLK